MVGNVGTVEKVFFVCRVFVTQHLMVLVHDIFDSGLALKVVEISGCCNLDGFLFLGEVSISLVKGERRTCWW